MIIKAVTSQKVKNYHFYNTHAIDIKPQWLCNVWKLGLRKLEASPNLSVIFTQSNYYLLKV